MLKTTFSPNLNQPVRYKHSDRMGVIWIDVVGVCLAKEIGQQQIVLAAVPFATDPSDAVHKAKGRELGDDQVLGPFAIELDQVDLVDAKVRYLRPKLLDGQRWNLNAEISVPWLKRFPYVRNIVSDSTVRHRERQQAFSWLRRDRCVDAK